MHVVVDLKPTHKQPTQTSIEIGFLFPNRTYNSPSLIHHVQLSIPIWLFCPTVDNLGLNKPLDDYIGQPQPTSLYYESTIMSKSMYIKQCMRRKRQRFINDNSMMTEIEVELLACNLELNWEFNWDKMVWTKFDS